MGILSQFLLLHLYVAALLVSVFSFAGSTVLIRFHQAPPAQSRFSTAIFRYSILKPDGTSACTGTGGCSVYCQLDGRTLGTCPEDNVVLKNLTVNQKHRFSLNVTTPDGKSNSTNYSWFIDTTPPTARIMGKRSYTNAEKEAIDVTFSEACSGQGGFKCFNSSNCDVIVNGPAHVDPSSLGIIKTDIKYNLNIVFSLGITYARVVISMVDNFCTDQAGNHFTRTNDSTFTFHFDRRPIQVDLWMPVPSYELVINGVPRTIVATNKMDDLKVFLDFSSPVINSTGEILSALRIKSGNFEPIGSTSHNNRRFSFQLKNISSTEIVEVELESISIIDRTGLPVSAIPPFIFLYDSTEPGVSLSTRSLTVTDESNIEIVIEFTKPVFDFEASKTEVKGGSLTRFEELSRALYSLTVKAESEDVSVLVPAGKVNDISGNQNLASNFLHIKHYSAPSFSVALHSFMTVGIIATSLAAAIISLSSANLEAIGILHGGGTLFTDPSINLQGMFGHLQVFVLANWIASSLPLEYSETTKGLRWILPREKIPWKKHSSSMWPNHLYMNETKLVNKERLKFTGFSFHKGAYLTNFSSHLQKGLFGNGDWIQKQNNKTMKKIAYGLPLDSSEYFTNFLRGEPLSATSITRNMERYTGWQDLEMNLFWLGVGGFSLLMIQILAIIFIQWRTQKSAYGLHSLPRFEFFLLILMLPSISQSSAFVIRGGTTAGILTGILLLAIPAGFILSVCLFLIMVIFSGSFVQYKEVKCKIEKEPWCKRLWFLITGKATTGKWISREGLPSSFLPRFGILFENRKGPPSFMLKDEIDPDGKIKGVESRTRCVSSDDGNEENKVPTTTRLFGYARSSYIILDLIRRVSFGIISGVHPLGGYKQGQFALATTLLQFLYLVILKPYISRGVNVVESVSLLCEAVVFTLAITVNGSNLVKESNLGYVMIGFLFLTYVSQITSVWYGIIKFLLRLSHPQKNSLKLGLKNAAKALILPFLPRKQRDKEVLNLERERGVATSSHPEQLSAMSATVVPVLSPGLSPQQQNVEQKNEMKKLRHLAKASFSRGSNYEEGSTSYAL